MTILGVDLGTTNSLAVVYKEGKPVLIPNAFGEYITPSAVSILDGKIVVGKLAKERLITHPECSASLFKRNMGTDVTYTLDKKEYDSATLSSFVVKQLIEDAQNYLHEEISEVEEYIDLIPILNMLYYDTETFLKPIKEVKIDAA